MEAELPALLDLWTWNGVSITPYFSEGQLLKLPYNIPPKAKQKPPFEG